MASSATEPVRENPFPAQAVMTFGPLPPTGTEFAYMNRALEPLKRYLIDYPKPDRPGALSAGGALGLVGEHGGGKTHLLAWLRNEVIALTRAQCEVAYAKADGLQFPDIYRQLLRNFSHQGMQEIVARAVRHTAATITGAALATQKIARQIEEAPTLESIYDGRTIDRNEVYLTLKKTIAETGSAPAVARKIAEMIGLLDDPTIGLAAFNWLCGNGAADPLLPATGPLFATGADPASDDPADVAVAALESLAVLFRLAETPLVLMIDQLENFIPADGTIAGSTSTLKKLSEQVGGQKAFVVLAGTRRAWDRFPRDVGPRMVRREPLAVGKLDLAETGLLLRAYLDGAMLFSERAIAEIEEVSGGSPREILQIAHRCFELVDGDLARADEATIFEAARMAGTLADREKLALADIDRILQQVGLHGVERRLPGGHLVHRLVNDDRGPVAAVVLAVATDPLAEVAAAESLASMRNGLLALSGDAELIVVTVGYSSDRVRRLVETISRIVVYGAPEWGHQLQAAMTELALARKEPQPVSAPPPAPLLEEVLHQIGEMQRQLGDIRVRRETQAQATALKLEEGVTLATGEIRAASGARTRWELLDTLDMLNSALEEGDRRNERGLLRSMLIANEAYLHIPALDHLGSLYMRALDADHEGFSPVNFDLKHFRRKVIGAIRDELLRTRSRLGDRRYAYGAAGFLLIGGYAGGMVVFFSRNSGFDSLAVVAAVTACCLVGGLAGALFGAFVQSPERRFRSLRNRLEELVPEWARPAP